MALLYFVDTIIHYIRHKSKHFNPHFFKTTNQSLTNKINQVFYGNSSLFNIQIFNHPSYTYNDIESIKIAVGKLSMTYVFGFVFCMVQCSNGVQQIIYTPNGQNYGSGIAFALYGGIYTFEYVNGKFIYTKINQ